ncbi:hypothetical protein TheetDRAFT_3375 [Thermoanaerobacter ethanolicus JW 200]|nr:hypothetical protein TheetDRAFT_3375 [Thermoanaerobacter ethanolicus JW 200]
MQIQRVKNKDFDKSKELVPAYLEEKIAKCQSAWTIKVARAALRKAYKDNELAKEVKIPERKSKRFQGRELKENMIKRLI